MPQRKFVYLNFFKSFQQVCAPAHAGRTQKLYVNWGFGTDNKARSPQQRRRG
jgi:hypothetical protein